MRARMLCLLAVTGCADPQRAEDLARAVTPLVWSGEQKLAAGDASEFDQLGYSVSLTEDRALVGAYGDDSYRGAAYLFVRSEGAWTEEQKLVASDGAESDAFGYSVTLLGDRALLGAYGDDSYRGAAYVFVRSGSRWIEEQRLVASDGAPGDNFGWSVSLVEDRALVGAFANDTSSGAAYVFVRSGGAWTEEQKLVASNRVEGDQFGYSVALSGVHALVGAPGNEVDRGAAHVFVKSDGDWTEEQKLVASDGIGGDGLAVPGDHFGVSVSLAEDRALLGAYFNDEVRGAAYVFARDGGAWIEEQKLVASDGASGHRFGDATSLRPDRALIGAFVSESARGAAYVFVRSGNAWTEEQKFVASDGVEGDLFGWSVSLADDGALIGAQAVENLRGAAYVFALGLENGAACSAAADCASGHCVDDRCCNSDCSGSCGACSIAEGASADGLCTVVPQGSEGSPPCDTLACTGVSPECSACEADEDCAEARHCAADQTCQPGRQLGEACDDGAGADCLLEGCRSCESGFCVDGVCCERECTAAEACTAELKISGTDGSCGAMEAGVDGSFCANGEACTSGHCADGVCCDATCSGACEACSAALKGEGEDGACGYVAAGLNPRRSSSEPTPDCAPDAQCNGGGECVSAPGPNAPEPSAPNDDAGCACRASGAAGHSADSWLGAALGLLLIRRRRLPSTQPRKDNPWP